MAEKEMCGCCGKTTDRSRKNEKADSPAKPHSFTYVIPTLLPLYSNSLEAVSLEIGRL